MDIIRYSPDNAGEWDRFVSTSRNGTLLHMRGYMDYHSDRFCDHSLMARDKGGRLIAILPACEEGTTLISHAGLTYGGWITPESHCGTAVMLDIFEAMCGYLRTNGFKELIYKPTPPIYHRYPAEEDIYALFRYGAAIDSCMVSSTIPLDKPLLISGNNRRDVAKARKALLTVSDTTDDTTLSVFWEMLTNRLREAHDVAPVHTLAEMKLLHSRWPDNIRLLSANDPEGNMIGGMLLYITPPVIHTQYIATTEQGRRHGSGALIIDSLYRSIISRRGATGSTQSPDTLLGDINLSDIRHIDFGVSCECLGRVLNTGLAAQKERLGGRATLYTRYRLAL